MTVIHVPLRARDGAVRAHALLDALDVPLLGDWRWSLTNGYASRNSDHGMVYLHRLVMGLDRLDEHHVDHLNRDRLDNRRANLRILDVGQNPQNCDARPVRINATVRSSRFRGVMWHKPSGLWAARVVVGGKCYSAGYHEDEELAACAVEQLRREVSPYSVPDPEVLALDGASATFKYEHCDVPPGIALEAWRRMPRP
jgi:hypothetical protein